MRSSELSYHLVKRRSAFRDHPLLIMNHPILSGYIVSVCGCRRHVHRFSFLSICRVVRILFSLKGSFVLTSISTKNNRKCHFMVTLFFITASRREDESPCLKCVGGVPIQSRLHSHARLSLHAFILGPDQNTSCKIELEIFSRRETRLTRDALHFQTGQRDALPRQVQPPARSHPPLSSHWPDPQLYN